MDRRLYQYCCLQLIHQFNTPWKYLQQNLDIFLFHSIIGKSIWVLFISNLWLSRCPLHKLLTILVHWHSCINIQMLMSGSISRSRARSCGLLIHHLPPNASKWEKCLLYFFFFLIFWEEEGGNLQCHGMSPLPDISLSQDFCTVCFTFSDHKASYSNDSCIAQSHDHPTSNIVFSVYSAVVFPRHSCGLRPGLC